MKRCADCKQDLADDQFTKSNPWYCRVCKNIRHKRWIQKKRDEALALKTPELPLTHKFCKECGESKPVSEFYLFRGRKLFYICKPCNSKLGQQRREFERRAGSRGFERLKYRCNRFGLSVDWYVAKEKEQDGTCALCHSPESNKCRVSTGELRGLSIDHDHETNQVRGLLCFRCNTALHQLEKHGLGWADAAVAYLKKYKETECNSHSSPSSTA